MQENSVCYTWNALCEISHCYTWMMCGFHLMKLCEISVSQILIEMCEISFVMKMFLCVIWVCYTSEILSLLHVNGILWKILYLVVFPSVGFGFPFKFF